MEPIEFDDKTGTLTRKSVDGWSRSNETMYIEDGAVVYNSPLAQQYIISLSDFDSFVEFLNDERFKSVLYEAQKVQKKIIIGDSTFAYYLYPDGNVTIIRGQTTFNGTNKYFTASQLGENELCALVIKIKQMLADGTAKEL